MEDKSKAINPGDPDKLPEADRTSDSYLRKNPGLKDENANQKKDSDKLMNEDPLEEKRAIEDTSEDRLSSAE